MAAFLDFCVLSVMAIAFFVIVGPRLRGLVKGVAAAILIVVMGLAILPEAPQFLGGESKSGWQVPSPFREIVLFVVMLGGMMARMLSLAIEKRRTAMEPRPNEQMPLKLDRWEFVYPTLVSIPTFGAVYTQLPSGVLDIPTLILAFQNGFFWQTVLKKQ